MSYLFVSFDIAPNLREPVVFPRIVSKLLVKRIQTPKSPLVTMPEVTIYEDNQPVNRHHNIRFPRHIGGMQAKAQASRPQRFPERHLGGRVPAFDFAHDTGNLFRRAPRAWVRRFVWRCGWASRHGLGLCRRGRRLFAYARQQRHKMVFGSQRIN